ncbi:hypothetical protein [Micromonospora sp. NPDC051296]|uniref:hypothetical protein n=1 Tax=Micromonospora sp. NPDC051296 TaxID=3155046 RepID=UPI0034274B7A
MLFFVRYGRHLDREVCLGDVCDSGRVNDRFRRLPPRIEPLYETQDVSAPPPLPEVSETIGLTAAGQIADLERLAGAIARRPDQRGSAPLVHDPAQRGWRRRVLVVVFGALALGMVAVAVMTWVG